MNAEETTYITSIIDDEGFDYCFNNYSSFLDIKDEEFHRFREQYLESRKKLEKYINLKSEEHGITNFYD